MIPASDRLYAAIVERRLTVPDDAELRQHVGRRDRDVTHGAGGASTKPHRADNIDAVVALAMALERAEFKTEPVEFVGWLYARPCLAAAGQQDGKLLLGVRSRGRRERYWQRASETLRRQVIASVALDARVRKRRDLTADT